MNSWNHTDEPNFKLMGLTDSKEIQLVLSVLFLFIYMATVLGNIGMMLIIRLDVQLHTPMYFFLTHLSFLDLSYSTVITPKTLENLLTSKRSISFMGCFIQLYLFGLLASTECFILSSMAYDIYVAICNPLHYPVSMFTRHCHALITVSYVIGAMDASSTVFPMSTLNFCKCKHKAFSTCASHLLGVTVFYGTVIFTYMKPIKSYSLGKNQVASVFYTIVIPMLNPLIYSLRNKQVKSAVLRLVKKGEGSQKIK
ncbi:olfactory receptor 8H1-like [Microtus ochrogaster]|uniref:Olfactory receptor 8H1-like n=1 Tax=Microtus ochrogaster TaxID=79684 RepID=A0ABM0LCU3_MICOH|nr:olfactory receptor 8H1-like [Microtus ochrogaster]